jgi:transketolase
MTISSEEKQRLTRIAHSVRALSVDAIERANSGHPGLPLGAAELGAFLYTRVLRHNPRNPRWIGRDRFVLSAGHGSMFLYSLLHLTGYDLTIEDLQNFRQLHSRTPGHPEYGETPGVETTTGPLGQGTAAATGMAIAQKLLAARFGEELFSSKVFVLAGDGCIMEGISSEAASLSGVLGLNNLVLTYDSNDVCLDGPTRECLAEDTGKRYEAYGWRVLKIDGYDFDQMEAAYAAARAEQEKPVLIIARTVIGRHATNRQGTSAAHGKVMGSAEMALLKRNIGWPDEPFFVPQDVRDDLKSLQPGFAAAESDWNAKRDAMLAADPAKASLWRAFTEQSLPEDFEEKLWNLKVAPNQATRKYSETCVQKIAEMVPYFVTGSADLSSCDFTWIKPEKLVARTDWTGRQIKFGVREFAMGACAYGMRLSGLLQPVVGTFLVFSDYMRNAVRVAALMRQRVIFVFSHDSILLAQDGPTHQPVEHVMSLRLIPGLTMIRPADENETKAAWAAVFIVKDQPVVLCLSRQPVTSSVSDLTAEKARQGVKRGAYILYGNSDQAVDVEIFAAGSELPPAADAARLLEAQGRTVRVVSVPSFELFDAQDEAYRQTILKGEAGLRVSVEAGRALGWQKFIGRDGLSISQETFGASAPDAVIVDHFGFTAEKIAQRIAQALPAAARTQGQGA